MKNESDVSSLSHMEAILRQSMRVEGVVVDLLVSRSRAACADVLEDSSSVSYGILHGTYKNDI